VPTKRRRHALTETPAVQAALDDVRQALHTDDVDIVELVILGAREKLARLRAEEQQTKELRRQLADRIRAGDIPVDISAADEVRRSGWVRP
jgi:predicted nuclease of predicted toxin-antitoxin system